MCRIDKKVDGVLTKGWLYQMRLHPIAELDGDGNVVSRFGRITLDTNPGFQLFSSRVGRVQLNVDPSYPMTNLVKVNLIQDMGFWPRMTLAEARESLGREPDRKYIERDRDSEIFVYETPAGAVEIICQQVYPSDSEDDVPIEQWFLQWIPKAGSDIFDREVLELLPEERRVEQTLSFVGGTDHEEIISIDLDRAGEVERVGWYR